jgi:mxaJ protein
MSFAFRRAMLALALTGTATTVLCEPLKVCADPDNFPFSDQNRAGFENHVIDLLARDLGRPVEYIWWTDRRAPPSKGLRRGQCEVVPAALAGAEGFATTQPWVHSAYVFVNLKDQTAPTGLDRTSIGARTIAVQSVGNEAPTPPAEVLIRNGLSGNLRPYVLRTRIPGPTTAKQIIDAVAAREVDVAVLWGPAAGYYAARASAPMMVTPIRTHTTGGGPPMTFAIAMAVRKDNTGLREAIDRALARHRDEISHILKTFSVPLVPDGARP